MYSVGFALILIVATAAIGLAGQAGTSPKIISPFGIVEGIVDCGSPGRLGRVEVTDCTQVPCKFIPNRQYDVAIRFTASFSSESLSLAVYRKSDRFQIIDLPILGSIEAGIEYEMKFVLPVTEELSGTAFDIQIYIWDAGTSWVEICAEAAIEVA